MRVCHLSSVHKATDVRIFHKECLAVKKVADEVHLVALNVDSEEKQGVYLHNISRQSNRFKRMTKSVKEVYKKALLIDADIYHFHDPELIPVGKKLKKKGKKVIYDVHEDLPRQLLNKTWIPKAVRKMVSKVVELYENHASKQFDLIVTATPFIKQRFLNIGCNTIDVNNYPKVDEFTKNNKQLIDNNICYVGGVSFNRGIRELVISINKLENVSLLLAGNFASQAQKEFVENMPGWKKVKQLGFLDRDGVNEVYNHSKLGLVTLYPTSNYMDALPVKMFEYMAAGLPVIASNFPAWKDIIEGNKCGICVDPMNTDEITNAINYLLNNQKNAEEMGNNGRQVIEKLFNWETESQKLIKAYYEIYNM